MRDDILACYPAIDPGRRHRDPQRDRHRRVPPGPRHGRARTARRSTPARPSVVFVGRDHAPEGPPPPARRGRRARPGAQLVLCAGAPDTPELAAEIVATRRAAARRRAPRASGSRRCSPRPELIQLLTHATRLRLPVGLRAARDRQPRGDGLRDRRRRDAHRRDPRGRRGRRHRPARPVRAARRRLGRAGRPGRVRPRARRADQRAARRPRARRAPRQGRPRARGRAVRLGGDRRRDVALYESVL